MSRSSLISWLKMRRQVHATVLTTCSNISARRSLRRSLPCPKRRLTSSSVFLPFWMISQQKNSVPRLRNMTLLPLTQRTRSLIPTHSILCSRHLLALLALTLGICDQRLHNGQKLPFAAAQIGQAFRNEVTVDVKGKTECYECQPKPVPKSYPVCTITSTPSKFVHCIVWAKDLLFAKLFGDAAFE